MDRIACAIRASENQQCSASCEPLFFVGRRDQTTPRPSRPSPNHARRRQDGKADSPLPPTYSTPPPRSTKRNSIIHPQTLATYISQPNNQPFLAAKTEARLPSHRAGCLLDQKETRSPGSSRAWMLSLALRNPVSTCSER